MLRTVLFSSVAVGICVMFGITGHITMPITGSIAGLIILAWVHIDGLRDPKGPVATPIVAILLGIAGAIMWVTHFIVLASGFKLFG